MLLAWSYSVLASTSTWHYLTMQCCNNWDCPAGRMRKPSPLVFLSQVTGHGIVHLHCCFHFDFQVTVFQALSLPRQLPLELAPLYLILPRLPLMYHHCSDPAEEWLALDFSVLWESCDFHVSILLFCVYLRHIVSIVFIVTLITFFFIRLLPVFLL